MAAAIKMPVTITVMVMTNTGAELLALGSGCVFAEGLGWAGCEDAVCS